MSREMKFRAWDDDRFVFMKFGEDSVEYSEGFLDVGFRTEEPIVWQQYTGLKDKNGVEIYEGDIVAVYPHGALQYELSEATICEVKWSDETAGWVGIYANISAWSRHEVIGNIYENPDLLTQEKEVEV